MEELGLREQNKLEKLERIKIAARDLFSEKGFDAATTRAIAKRARVAEGTLFNYADDKRDLIFLVMSDGLNAAIRRATEEVDYDLPLIDQITNTFWHVYHYFSEDIKLSGILLRELPFYNTGKLSAGFQNTRQELINLIERIVVHAQKTGEIRDDGDPVLIARGVFFIYSGAVRWWIEGKGPTYEFGLVDLRALLRPYIEGLSAKKNKKKIAEK